MMSDLLKLECPTAGPNPNLSEAACCKPIAMETTKNWMFWRLRLLRKQHWWLDEQIVDNLPTQIKKGRWEVNLDSDVFCSKLLETVVI